MRSGTRSRIRRRTRCASFSTEAGVGFGYFYQEETGGGVVSEVRAQYEAYPYPARDPAEEKKRLITGSPSHVLEVDHFVFEGARDWSKPLRVLVAGGGTGDALIQLAQQMQDAGRV